MSTMHDVRKYVYMGVIRGGATAPYPQKKKQKKEKKGEKGKTMNEKGEMRGESKNRWVHI